jgi:hypothetical protein
MSKYVKQGIVSCCYYKPSQSHFWEGLLKVKEFFFCFCRKNIGNSKMTRFWEDLWIGNKPLNVKFARLYNIAVDNNVLV